ncbi:MULTISPECIES: synaptonemal complex protein 1 [Streptomyces]|uniref:hypothetical protein n=1 Tax=Streptomyces TaxID=1883 RepID=UPI002FEFDA3F
MDSSGKTYKQLADELHWSETRIRDFIRLYALPTEEFIEDLARVTLPEVSRDKEMRDAKSRLQAVIRSAMLLPAPVPRNAQRNSDAPPALEAQLDRALRRWSDAENIRVGVETARIFVLSVRADAERHINELTAKRDALQVTLDQAQTKSKRAQIYREKIAHLERRKLHAQEHLSEARKKIRQLEQTSSAAGIATEATRARIAELELEIASYRNMKIQRPACEPTAHATGRTAEQTLEYAATVNTKAYSELRRIAEEESEEPPISGNFSTAGRPRSTQNANSNARRKEWIRTRRRTLERLGSLHLASKTSIMMLFSLPLPATSAILWSAVRSRSEHPGEDYKHLVALGIATLLTAFTLWVIAAFLTMYDENRSMSHRDLVRIIALALGVIQILTGFTIFLIACYGDPSLLGIMNDFGRRLAGH